VVLYYDENESIFWLSKD
jgi:diacylglycerol kinase family enzyme